MKKATGLAIFLFLLSGCYTPLNNSGVATTKSWLEVSGKKLDFDGKQYDSCYRFNIHFWPPQAAEQLDLREACVSACCWRSDKEEVVLDFNKNFESDLARYGRARKYTPGQIKLKVTHANWLNTTKVTISPHGSIRNNGLVKLSYKEHENPARLAQLAEQKKAADAIQIRREIPGNTNRPKHPAAVVRTAAKSSVQTPAKPNTLPSSAEEETAKMLFQHLAGPKVDAFFYQMDKTYKKQGAVFLLSQRILHVHPGSVAHQFTLVCQAQARTGMNAQQLKASTFPCGTWAVDTAVQAVYPADPRAQLIWK